MSLLGALSLGGSALAAQQTALQVTGNNIANAGTAGYTRQVANLSDSADISNGQGLDLGTGVTVTSIQRQANEALNDQLRGANSDSSAASTLDSQLTQLQTIFGPLNQNDLAAQMTSFFNGFSTLANNPTDDGQRSVVIQNGVSLAQNLQSLRNQLTTMDTNAQAQIATQATEANSLTQQIATLNGQIASQGGSAANSLLDQRDQALTQLSQMMNIRVIDQGNGTVNVLVGSTPLVTGSTSRGVSSKEVPNATNTFPDTEVVFGDNGDPMNVSGGQLGGLLTAQSTYIDNAISTIDTVAGGLISSVNSISTQGQGTAGFSAVTGTTQVLDPTAALNAATTTTGIAFPPTNGSFNLDITNATTGQVTTQQINVNLSGQGTPTTLNSLAASITAAGGGTVSATVNPSGTLSISSNDSNVTFGFSEDTSGTLAALGINTFFSGTNAANINVNSTLQNNPDLLATGRGNVAGSNANAQALALAGSASVAQLGGSSLTDYYQNYIGNLAAQAQTVSDNSTAQTTIQQTLTSQQQAVSGVSMDEETINMLQYQRAYEGSARFISAVDECIQNVLGLIQ